MSKKIGLLLAHTALFALAVAAGLNAAALATGLAAGVGMTGTPPLAVKLFASLPWLFGAVLLDQLLHAFAFHPMSLAGASGGAPRLLRTIGRVLIGTTALVCIIAFAFEQPVTPLLATSGVLTVVLGFALKETISDVFSGIAIGLERPYKLGHWVKPEGHEPGRVIEINWRATRLLTQGEEEIIVPNRLMANSALVNFSTPEPKYRENIELVLGNENDPARVEKIILGALMATPEIIPDGPHRARLAGFGPHGTLWHIKFWIADYGQRIPAIHSALAHVIRHLRAAGIEIPYQRMEMLTQEETLAEFHNKNRATPARALLDRVDVLSACTPQERDRLASAAREVRVQKDEAIIRQGDAGHSLFILVEGLLEASMSDAPGGTVRTVGRIEPGQAFGEMSFLTGAPRTATLTALTPAVALELDSEIIGSILCDRPTLADQLAAVMARNRAATTAATERAATAEPAAVKTLADRIRAFFSRRS